MSTASETSVPETTIMAPADLPTITIQRTFASTPSQVFRAFVEPELFSRWIGPHSIEARIDHWDARTGGSWRYAAWRDGERVAGFYGSFHEIRPDERLVQTFTYDGAPDGVSLDTTTFTALPDGGTRLTTVSVVESLEIRNLILASGMDSGVREGYAKLDVLLQDRAIIQPCG
ncbi:MAG: SRPBCC family protein [Candidatus Dormiibacterota bacterium]